MSEQEEIVQYLKAEYSDKKLPHAANQLRISHHGAYATLDTGTSDGQITVVGVRFHDSEYEVRDYRNKLQRYKTFEQMKAGLATFLGSVSVEQLEQGVKESITQ
jgi:predicted aldo/keto reductase-like oxidoreductase